MPTVIVSFDAEGAETPEMYKELADHGLHQVSPHKSLELPETTLLGTTSHYGKTAEEIRDAVKKVINRHVKPDKVTHIVAGVVSDWAVHNGEKRKDAKSAKSAPLVIKGK